MSLRLILGSSGSGKSYKMLGELVERSLGNPDLNYIVIVPEQFTMQTQKDLVMMHPNHGMINIDIVSFARLAFRIFEELGIEALEVLDDTGKSLILRKTIERKKKELVVYQNKIKMPGFIAEVKSMISEIIQYGIQEKELEDMLEASANKPVLKAKLQDIKVIYTGFKEFLENKYITTEEILDILCRHIPQSDYLKQSEIYVDGFTGFTPVQYKVLGLLMKCAKRITITVTIPYHRLSMNEIGKYHLFYLSKTTINQLMKTGENVHTEIENPILMDDQIPYRFQENKTLADLEKNIFNTKKKRSTYDENAIQIHITANPYAEAEFVAREIFTLIRESGYHFRDIAVITGDIEGYYRVIQEVFTLNHIPYFIDYKKALTTNPFIEAIRALLEIMESRFSYESVFRFLRSGMINVLQEDLDKLDNYVIAKGIRGLKTWKKDWSIEDESVLSIKTQVIQPIIELYEQMKKPDITVVNRMTLLYQYITEQKMFNRLVTYRGYFLDENQIGLAKEYEQVYRLVMELFDKLVSLLGDEVLTFKDFRSILEAGFEEIKVGIIPPTIDQVMVGDMERTRLNHIKALFFVGINEGIIPKSGGKKGLLSDNEREFLSDNHIELSPGARESSFIEKYYLYLNLTKPTEKLVLSFSKTSSNGTALRPSYLIYEMMKVFPEIKIIDEDMIHNPLKQIISEYSGMKVLSEEIRDYVKKDMHSVAKDLFSLFSEEGLKQKKLEQLIEAAFFQKEDSKLDKAVAKALFNDGKFSSVSRMERYASCAYQHFLNYGLALVERKEYAIEAVDLGNLYHKSIELFSKRLQKSGFDLRNLPEEFRGQLVHECVLEVTRDYRNTVLLSSARNSYIIRRVERITNRTVWALSEHIKRGKFMPEYYEMSVEHGRIDRVDTYNDGTNLYVKIIDYKSGNKLFNVVDTYYHLQLQLLIYMKDVMDREKQKHQELNIIPAAACYYHIKDPIINKGEELIEQFQMSGLINCSEAVVDALDTELEGKSIVAPINRKNGKLYQSANLITNQDFHLLIEHVQQSVEEISRDIIDGNIQVNPYIKKSITSCDYCPYKAVCGFDPKLSGYQYRKVDDLKPEEVWNLIKGDEKE